MFTRTNVAKTSIDKDKYDNTCSYFPQIKLIIRSDKKETYSKKGPST